MTECDLPMATISGRLTAAPLAMREATQMIGPRFTTLEELREGGVPLAWLQTTVSSACAVG